MGIVDNRDDRDDRGEIEAALRSYPMEPLPGEFTAKVMRRVKELRRDGQAAASFRFPWADLAGSLCLACMAGLGLGIWQVSRAGMLFSPALAGRLHTQVLLTEQWLRMALPGPVLWMVMGGAAMAVCMFFTTWRMFGRRR